MLDSVPLSETRLQASVRPLFFAIAQRRIESHGAYFCGLRITRLTHGTTEIVSSSYLSDPVLAQAEEGRVIRTFRHPLNTLIGKLSRLDVGTGGILQMLTSNFSHSSIRQRKPVETPIKRRTVSVPLVKRRSSSVGLPVLKPDKSFGRYWNVV